MSYSSRLPTICISFILKHCWIELLFRTRIVHQKQGSLLAFICRNWRGSEMGREMLYDNSHVRYRVTARNNRTVEQMWGSSVPHFPDFEIVSIDSHGSQMSVTSSSWTGAAGHFVTSSSWTGAAGHFVWLRPTCGSLQMIKAREGVSSSVNSSYLLWGFCPHAESQIPQKNTYNTKTLKMHQTHPAPPRYVFPLL